MVIDCFDLVRIPVLPDKTNAPLVVNPNAVLTGPCALEGFEPVGWGHPEIVQTFRVVELDEFAKGSPLNIRWEFSRSFALPNLFRLFASEMLNHSSRL